MALGLSIGDCCGCGPVFSWGRYIRRVGEETANATLSDFSVAWSSFEALAPTETPPHTELKMKPIRYEFGMLGGGNYATYVSRSQQNVGPRSTAPPITGHLRSTPVSEVQIPGTIALNTGALNARNSANSILRAAELYLNGSSLGLFDFGTTYPLERNSQGSLWVHNPLVITLPSAVSLIPTDTMSFDLYAHVKSRGAGYISATSDPSYGMVFAPSGTQPASPVVASCQMTGVQSRISEVTGYKLVFSDTGPSGLTEFELHAQSGWSVDASGTVFTRDSEGEPYFERCIVTFNWLREIPYVEIHYPDKFPVGSGLKVRYFMQGTGDYTPIDIVGASTLTYSTWGYTSPALFDARVILSGSRWYSDLELADSPHFDGWPNSITVRLI